MPDIEREGVTLSEALQEAAAVAPVGRAMLYAYELWHESFAEPIRFVNDVAALTATLEAAAPRDAGDEVEFLACPLSLQRPEESDTAASPSVTLGRPDVAGLLKAALDAARGSTEPWTIIERVYASDDTSTPAMLPPLTFEVTGVELAGAAASLTASYGDWVNWAVPRTTFRRAEYPGLSR
jgi:hypothetical protein